MASCAILREEILPRDTVPQCEDGRVQCPKCKGQNLVVKGNLQVSHEEIWAAGEAKNEETGTTPCFEIERFDCIDCRVRYVVQPRKEAELQTLVDTLAQKLLVATGEDFLGRGKPC